MFLVPRMPHVLLNFLPMLSQAFPEEIQKACTKGDSEKSLHLRRWYRKLPAARNYQPGWALVPVQDDQLQVPEFCLCYDATIATDLVCVAVDGRWVSMYKALPRGRDRCQR